MSVSAPAPRTGPRTVAGTLGLLLVAAFVGCDGSPDSPSEGLELAWVETDGPQEGDYLPAPALSLETFPCSDCHDPEIPVNRRVRELKLVHAEIPMRHASSQTWCLDCHDDVDRDQLRLSSGEKVPFEDVLRLCGQCHGSQLRDWRAGVHGLRTGAWNGEKTYLQCVYCHDAHDPAFRPIEPEPPPRAPTRTP